MSQVRDLSLSLRPPMLDVLGLDAAVRSCVEQHRQQTGCDVQLEIQLESRLSPELEGWLQQRIWEDVTHGSLSSDGQFVFAPAFEHTWLG